MSAKKDTTESRLHAISGGEEPTFTGTVALKEMDLCRHLNWYKQHRDTAHAQKYLQAFCTQHNIPFTEAQIKSRANTLGFVCRMLSRGAILGPEAAMWLQDSIQKMEHTPAPLPVLKGATSDRPKPAKAKPVVQDSSQAKLSACIADLEFAVDEIALDCKARKKSPLAIMQQYGMTAEQLPVIINKFKKVRDEFRVALDESDPIIVEGYSNFDTPELKALESYTDQIISDALVMIGANTKQKAPRKKKVKTPAQLTKGVKYHPGPNPYVPSPLDPTKIIGAAALFLYNIKTRQLGCYIADTEEGLSVKGSTILNYTKSRSIGKTLRKPEQQLPQLLAGGKIVAKHFLSTINAKEKALNGRINKDCLLLKVL